MIPGRIRRGGEELVRGGLARYLQKTRPMSGISVPRGVRVKKGPNQRFPASLPAPSWRRSRIEAPPDRVRAAPYLYRRPESQGQPGNRFDGSTRGWIAPPNVWLHRKPLRMRSGARGAPHGHRGAGSFLFLQPKTRCQPPGSADLQTPDLSGVRGAAPEWHE